MSVESGSDQASGAGLRPLKQAARRAVDWAGVRVNRIEAFWYDLKNKTDTGGKTPAAQLDIPADSVEHVTGFQSVNERHLQTVLENVDFPAGSVFVDIGCGKGKALLIAAKYPFVDTVVGVELAESLCVASERNMEVARARGVLTKASFIVHQDATEVDYNRGENIFFLNNPFDAAFMMKMIDLLEAHAKRYDRKIWILYGNPQHADAIAADGRLTHVKSFGFFGPGRDITVYTL